jgi:uncharacterized protein YjbI with pentapeptide repeats
MRRMQFPPFGKKKKKTSQEDELHLRRGEHYLPHLMPHNKESDWQKLWKRVELKEEEQKEVRAMINQQVENHESSHSDEQEQHIRRTELVSPHIPSKKWKFYLWRVWKWTGIAEKKGWDFLQLLVIPVVLGLLGLWFNNAADMREQNLAKEQNRQDALVKYINEIAENIYSKQKNQTERISLLQAKTRATLQLLREDPERRDILITFLRESELLDIPEQKESEPKPLLFEEINLRKADLSQADLRRVKLTKADLSNATLRAIHLNDADLKEANLSGADLSSNEPTWLDVLIRKIDGKNDTEKQTTLIKTNLKGAYLINAKLYGANLTKANLIGANLKNVSFNQKTKFDYALYNSEDPNNKTKFPEDFDPSNEKMIEVCSSKELQLPQDQMDLLKGVDLSDLKLTKIVLKNANLEGVDLSGSDLVGAVLDDTNLTGATMEGTDLTAAELKKADLTNVDLRTTKGVNRENLLNEATLCNTTLPNGEVINKDCPEKGS